MYNNWYIFAPPWTNSAQFQQLYLNTRSLSLPGTCTSTLSTGRVERAARLSQNACVQTCSHTPTPTKAAKSRIFPYCCTSTQVAQGPSYSDFTSLYLYFLYLVVCGGGELSTWYRSRMGTQLRVVLVYSMLLQEYLAYCCKIALFLEKSLLSFY